MLKRFYLQPDALLSVLVRSKVDDFVPQNQCVKLCIVCQVSSRRGGAEALLPAA